MSETMQRIQDLRDKQQAARNVSGGTGYLDMIRGAYNSHTLATWAVTAITENGTAGVLNGGPEVADTAPKQVEP